MKVITSTPNNSAKVIAQIKRAIRHPRPIRVGGELVAGGSEVAEIGGVDFIRWSLCSQKPTFDVQEEDEDHQ